MDHKVRQSSGRQAEAWRLAAITTLVLSLSSYVGDAQQVLDFPALLRAANQTSSATNSSQSVSLQLGPGTFNVTQTAVFRFSDPGSQIIIIGQGPQSTVLDCNTTGVPVARALAFVGAGSVTLQGITIQNCNSTQPGFSGGGVYIQAYEEVIIRNTTFLGCGCATGGAVFIAPPLPSAPLQATNISLTVERSAFVRNTAYDGGGGPMRGGGAIKLLGVQAHVAITNCLFQDSFANGPGGALSVEGVNGSLSVTKTQFFRNAALRAAAILVNNTLANITLDGCDFQANFARDFGGAFQVGYHNGSVDVSNTNFIGNAVTQVGWGGACAFGYVNGSINFSNCLVKDNSAVYVAGLHFLGNTGRINLVGMTFYNNSAWNSSGSVLALKCTTRLFVRDSLFQANTAGAAGGGFSVDTLFSSQSDPDLDGSVWIYNTTFDNNYHLRPDAKFSAVVLANIPGSVKVEKTNFTNHNLQVGDVKGGVLLLGPIGGTIEIADCLFHNNSCEQGLSVSYSTQVLVRDSTFTNTKGAAARFSSGSSVLVNSTFDNNGAVDFSAVAVTRGLLEIHACRFTNNIGAVGGAILGVDGSSVRIDPGIYYNGVRIYNLLLGDLGVLLSQWSSQGRSFDLVARTWSPTTFVNNTAYAGGAIAVIDSQLKISNRVPDMPEQVPYASNTSFIRNKALTGGAITIIRGMTAGDSQVDLCYMWLEGNEATTPEKLPGIFSEKLNATEQVFMATQYGMGVGNGGGIAAVFSLNARAAMLNCTIKNNIAEGYGGGIYLGVIPSECPGADSNCFQLGVLAFNWRGNTTIVDMTGNVARNGAGGAIYYENLNTLYIWCDQGPSIKDGTPCPQWTNNSAPVGPIIATTPTSAKPTPNYIKNYTSGQDVQIDIALYDAYGNLHAPPQPNSRSTDVAAFTVVDPAASGQLQTQVGGLSSARQRSFQGLRLKVAPGNHSLTIAATVPFLNRVFQNMTVTLDVRQCVIGEASLDNGTLCAWCDAGQYSTDPQAGCLPCPDNSLCNQPAGEQQGIIVPEQQYWNSNPFSEQVYLCPNGAACQAPNRTERLIAYQDTLRQDPSKYNRAEFYAAMCAKGYTGNFCTQCAPGYGYVGSAQCAPCYSRGVSALIYAIVTIVSLLPFFFAYLSESYTSSQYWAIEMESRAEEEEEAMAGGDAKLSGQGGSPGAAVSSLSLRKGALPDLEMPDAEPEVKAKQEYVDHFETLSSIIKVALSYLQVISLMKFIILPTFPSTFDNTVDVAETVSVFPGNAVSLHCSLPEDLSIPPAIVTVALALTLPMGAELFVACLVLMAWYMPKWSRNLKARAADRFPTWKWLQPKDPAQGSKDAGVDKGKDIRVSDSGGRSAAKSENQSKNKVLINDKNGSDSSSPHATCDASARQLNDPSNETPDLVEDEKDNAAAAAEMVCQAPERKDSSAGTQAEKGDSDEASKAQARLPLRYKMALVIIVGTFAFYEHFVTTFLNILACVSGDSSNTTNQLAVQSGLLTGYWWRYDFSQQCFQGSHAALAYVIAIPGVIVFAVGCPVFTCWYLGHNRYRLDEPDFTAVWGFVYAEYRPAYFAWESVIMLRKIAVSALIVLLSSSPNNTGLQLLSGIAVIATALVAHQTCQPYKEEQVSRLETLSLTTTLISLYLSSYFMLSTVQNSYNVIPWIIIAINILTMAIFAWNLYTAFLDSVLATVGLKTLDEHGSSPDNSSHDPNSPAGGLGSGRLSTAHSNANRISLIQQKLDPIVGKRLAVPSAYVVQGLAKAHSFQRKAGDNLRSINHAAFRTSRKLLGWDVEAQEQLALSRGKSGYSSGPLSQRSLTQSQGAGHGSQRARSATLTTPRPTSQNQRNRSIPLGQQGSQRAGSSQTPSGDKPHLQPLPCVELALADAAQPKGESKQN